MSETLIRKNFCLQFYHEAQTPEASEGTILQVKFKGFLQIQVLFYKLQLTIHVLNTKYCP
jgi:hypothetical protein